MRNPITVIRSWFAWEMIDRVSMVEYWENQVTGERRAHSNRISGKFYVKPNHDWLEGRVTSPRHSRPGKPDPSPPVRF